MSLIEENLPDHKHISSRTILVIDDMLPRFNKDSGSQRMMHLLKIFKELGYHVIFVPSDGHLVEPYYTMLKKMDIEVVDNKCGLTTRKKNINKLLPRVNIAWICRPNVNRKFQYIFKDNNHIKWIYDTVDLHFIRHSREAEICKNPIRKFQLKRRSKRYKKLETDLAKLADVTIAITPIEAEILKENNAREVRIVPNIHIRKTESVYSFEQREGILFIGSYDHSPNRDAVIWLVKQIMPLVWQEMPGIKVNIVGNNPNQEIERLATSNVLVTGFVTNVDDYFNTCKVFVAPLRYGAGMKGKIGHALEYALPIVSTSIGSEGMNLENCSEILIADKAHEFAEKIIELYTNKPLWSKIHENAAHSLAPFSYEAQKNNLNSIFNFTNNKH